MKQWQICWKEVKVTTNQSRVIINIVKVIQNITPGSLFKIEGGVASQKSPGRPEQQVTRNINSSIRSKFKTLLKKFMEDKLLNISKNGKTSHQINLYYRWLQEILLNLKVKFLWNIKQRIPVFFPEEEVEIQFILEEVFDKQIVRETTHESTEFLSLNFMVKNPDCGDKINFELERVGWVFQIWTF